MSEIQTAPAFWKVLRTVILQSIDFFEHEDRRIFIWLNPINSATDGPSKFIIHSGDRDVVVITHPEHPPNRVTVSVEDTTFSTRVEGKVFLKGATPDKVGE